MDRLDSGLRQELLKHGLEVRATSNFSTIIRALLRELGRSKDQATGVGDLVRQNAVLGQDVMHYKMQLFEKNAELEGLKKTTAENQKAYEEHVAFLERTVPQIAHLPKSSILREAWGSDVARDVLDHLHYADRRLHDLEKTNRGLRQELDRQFVQTSGLLLKIQIRDNELQRLNDLIGDGKWRTPNDVMRSDQAADGHHVRLLQNRVAELQQTLDDLRAGRKVPTIGDSDVRKQLELAEAARKDLAAQVDRLNEVNTSLKGVAARYEYQLKMVRLERDNLLSQLQEQQRESLFPSRAGENDGAAEPSNRLLARAGPGQVFCRLDENGNDANCGSRERTKAPKPSYPARQAGDVQKDPGLKIGHGREEEDEVAMDAVEESSEATSLLLERVAVYERNIDKLTGNLRLFRDAIEKKDAEIASLRCQIAVVAAAHEENGVLHEELAKLRAESRTVRSELMRHRRQVRDYTKEAARATELAAENERRNVRERAEARREFAEPTSLPQAAADMVTAPGSSRFGTDGPGSSGVGQQPNRPTGSQQTTASTQGRQASTGGQQSSADSTDVRVTEKLALLERNVAELNARTSLEVERRKQAEQRLLQMEQNCRRQQQQQPDQPPKKFKASIQINQINGEIEFDPEQQ